ncbi:12374_t:CDS:2 [Racocetra fulgida]|uniref:12374_t:CDS:1 n=1 Tax=Racocetra fulgida TaxID=60492 RepID=A0A9N8ZTA4_9GLOM|nr:12374_t:CDS:2 [Racocetra fulgida]
MVVGLDISPYQPTTIKPNNFEFVKGNVQERLPFDDNTFDFVFQRFLVFGLIKDKCPDVMNELVRVLKPGGFLELCEPSNVFDAGPVTRRLWDCGVYLAVIITVIIIALFVYLHNVIFNYHEEYEILEELGSDFNLCQKLEAYCQNQGYLENIKKEVKRVYYGPVYNNAELSKAILNNIISVYASLKPILTKKMQISDEEYDELTKTSVKEVVEHNSYFQIVRVYATKVIHE